MRWLEGRGWLVWLNLVLIAGCLLVVQGGKLKVKETQILRLETVICEQSERLSEANAILRDGMKAMGEATLSSQTNSLKHCRPA